MDPVLLFINRVVFVLLGIKIMRGGLRGYGGKVGSSVPGDFAHG